MQPPSRIKQTPPVEVRFAGPGLETAKGKMSYIKGPHDLDDDKLFSEFERRLSSTDDVKEESLVDEIMSHINFKNQNDSAASYDEICDLDVKDASTDEKLSRDQANESKSKVDHPEHKNHLKTDKALSMESKQLSLENKSQSNISHSVQGEVKTKEDGTALHGWTKRSISVVQNEAGLSERLAELRTRLVQLKQDR